VAELAGELELPKGTVHGILSTLQSVGFVEQDSESGKYQLGAALLHMGSTYLDGNELRARALNWADALATRTGESVRIGTLHDYQVLIVHHVFRPDDSRQALEVGSLMPAHATALGKTLLAHHRYLATELASGDLPGFTPATITDGHRLNGSLDEISGRGWAVEVEELFLGVAAIAAPIEDRRRVIAGAIGISGSIQRICQDRSPRAELLGYVMESARSVSRELGGIPW
jgi:DNA-binding IclR family transcriptional regulator